jgi:hypothetical protein
MVIPMPGRCPVCSTTITHEAETLQATRLYRCLLCRLEFVVDARTGKLVRARFDQVDSADKADHRRDRSA